MRLIGVLFILLCFLSCTDKKKVKDEIMQLQSYPIRLSFDKMQCMWNGEDTTVSKKVYEPPLKLVVYSDTSACSSCKLKTMHLWDEFIKELQPYSKNASLLFIFSPAKKDLDRFYLSMKTMAPLLPMYVDTIGIFAHDNPHVPQNAIYHTFLLDENNHVILVGDPSRNERIEELFWKIVKERLGERH